MKPNGDGSLMVEHSAFTSVVMNGCWFESNASPFVAVFLLLEVL
jgi:hypothetical protein